MKFCQSILSLASAGLLLVGCATPSSLHQSRASAANSTNSTAANSAPLAKGNPEALARFATGVSLELNNQPQLAMEEYDKSVLADPSNEALALELAQEFLKQSHAEKAITILSKVARRPDAAPPVLTWLARAQLQAGHTNDALATSHLAVERRPDRLDGYEVELEVLAHAGKTQEAVKTLDRASHHVRNEPAELISLADLYAAFLVPQPNEKNSARLRALALLDRAALLPIPTPALRMHLGDAYGRLGEIKKAANIYTNLLASTNDTALTRNALRLKLGQTFLDSRDWTNAAAQFRAVVRDDPVRYPEAWYFLGILAHSDQKLEEAAEYFGNALRAEPKLEQAYYRLALVRADMNRVDEALQILERARALFPETFDGQFFTGLVYNQAKDFGESVKHFLAAGDMARLHEPGRLDRAYYFQLGAAYERDHQFAPAAVNLQKCIDLAPDDAEALNYLGFMWADRGENLNKAKTYIEKAVKLDPKNAAFLDSLGWVWFKLNQPQQALPWLVKAVELSEKPDPTILDHLGDVYMALHQPAKALEMWKKSIGLEPNDDIKKKLRFFDAGAA